jgi:hypothetical protein
VKLVVLQCREPEQQDNTAHELPTIINCARHGIADTSEAAWDARALQQHTRAPRVGGKRMPAWLSTQQKGRSRSNHSSCVRLTMRFTHQLQCGCHILARVARKLRENTGHESVHQNSKSARRSARTLRLYTISVLATPSSCSNTSTLNAEVLAASQLLLPPYCQWVFDQPASQLLTCMGHLQFKCSTNYYY